MWGGGDSWGRRGGQPVRRGVTLSYTAVLPPHTQIELLCLTLIWSRWQHQKSLLSRGGTLQSSVKRTEHTAERNVEAGAEHQRL